MPFCHLAAHLKAPSPPNIHKDKPLKKKWKGRRFGQLEVSSPCTALSMPISDKFVLFFFCGCGEEKRLRSRTPHPRVPPVHARDPWGVWTDRTKRHWRWSKITKRFSVVEIFNTFLIKKTHGKLMNTYYLTRIIIRAVLFFSRTTPWCTNL